MMKFNSLKLFILVFILSFIISDLQALPLPIPPNISIQDVFKHGKRAIEKNKDDKKNQKNYEESQKEFEKNINNEEEKIIEEKKELVSRFNGNWTGQFLLKDEKDLNISCNIKVIINNSDGLLNSKCKNIVYEIYFFINLDRNLEKSYIKTNLQKDKISLYGDLTSFHGKNKQIYIRGNMEKY